jgi:hypothetical protein
MREEWTWTWTCADLQTKVTKLADQMPQVKKLVCFGLGPVSGIGRAAQHMIAVTIAETLTAC